MDAKEKHFSSVSVIVPVYNNNDGLRNCLDALSSQDYPSERFEVVVVDNGSQQDVSWVASFGKNICLVTEDTVGSYAARNKGIRNSNGDLIAFTDSDCIPAEDWISSGVREFLAMDNGGLLGGKIVMFAQEPDKPTAVELYEMAFGLNQRKYVEKKKFAATANAFTSRTVIECVGLFDEELKSGGDSQFGNRVFHAGFAVAYAETVRVDHPARRTLLEIAQKVRRVAGGRYDMKARSDGTSSKLSVSPGGPRSAISKVVAIYENEHYGGLFNTLKILGVASYVTVVTEFERLRLVAGGRSLRG